MVAEQKLISMRAIYLIAILVFSKIILAQSYIPFPADTAEWDIKKVCQVSSCPPPYQPTILTQLGDTTLNSLVYHKIRAGTANNLYAFYREQNKRIYIKFKIGTFGNDTSEFVLYDFNLIVGDTFFVKVPNTYTNVVQPPCQKRIVSSITTTVLSSGTHNVYNFYGSGYPCYVPNLQWIEGVGSASGFLYNLNYYEWSTPTAYPNPSNFTLICNFRKSGLYYSNGCPITSLKEIKDKNEYLVLYPNPTNDIVNIENSNASQIKKIIVYNILGDVILVEKGNEMQNSLNLKDWPQGIYFCKLIFQNDEVSKIKIIKN